LAGSDGKGRLDHGPAAAKDDENGLRTGDNAPGKEEKTMLEAFVVLPRKSFSDMRSLGWISRENDSLWTPISG
jgi:hypothetical protein